MHVLLFVVLLGSALAQPPRTTEAPKGFFERLGDVIKDTAGAFAGSFTSYVKEQGNSILHEVLPGIVGKVLSSGLWDMIGTAIDQGKRDLNTDLQSLHDNCQHLVEEAVNRAEGLEVAVKGLVGNLLHGRITPEQFAQGMSDLTENARDLLSTMTEGMKHEVANLIGHGNKRQISVSSSMMSSMHSSGMATNMNVFNSMMTNIQTSGMQVFNNVNVNVQSMLQASGMNVAMQQGMHIAVGR